MAQGQVLNFYDTSKSSPVWTSDAEALRLPPGRRTWTLTRDGRLLIVNTIPAVGGQNPVDRKTVMSVIDMETLRSYIADGRELLVSDVQDISLNDGQYEPLDTLVDWYVVSIENNLYIEALGYQIENHWIHCYDSNYRLVPEKRIPIGTVAIKNP